MEDMKAPTPQLESAELYKTLFENASDAIFTMENHQFIECNEMTLKMFGCEKDEIIGHHPWEFSPPEQPDGRSSEEKAKELIGSAFEGNVQRFYWKHIRKDKTPFDAEVSLSLMNVGENKFLQAIVRDITERKLAEDELHRLTAIMENTSDLVSTATSDKRITYINSAGRRLIGWKEDENLGDKNIADVHPKWAWDIINNEGIPAAVRDGIWRGETALLRTDGTEIPVSQVIMSHKSESGDLEYLSTIMRDISKEKKAEAELRQSEEWYRSLIENSASVYSVVDAQGKAMYQSPSIERVYGWTPEELKGKSLFERIHPDDLEQVMDGFKDLLKNPGNVNMAEVRYRHKDGSWRMIEALGANHLDNPAIRGIMITSHDITERKIAEEKLRESEEKYRELVENINDIIYIVDKEGIRQYISPAIERATGGFKPSDLEGRIYNKYIHPDDVERIAREFKVRLSGKPGTVEFRTHTKTGEILWVRDSSRPIIEDGEVIGIQGVMRDITEYKEAEEALRESEEKFRSLISHIPGVVWRTDIEGNTSFISPFVEGVYGYTPREIREGGDKLWFGRIHPDDVEKVRKEFGKLFEEGTHLNVEYRIQRKDGRWIWLRDRSFGTFEQNGRLYADGIFFDITGQKKAEQDIYNIFNLSTDLLCIIDLKTDHFIKINPSFERILGRDTNELLSKPYLEFVHPKDTKKTDACVRADLPGQKAVQYFENRIMCKDGDYKWFGWSITPIIEEGFVYAVGRDISEQKSRERELHKRLMNYKIDEGNIYLVLEKKPDKVMEAFRDLLNAGYEGLIFSRTPEREFERYIEREFDFAWLAESEKENAVPPDLDRIQDQLNTLPAHETIMLDRLDYLITKNGFDSVLSFIQKLRELSYLKDFVVLLSVDPVTMSEREKGLIEKECRELVPIHETMISQELLEIMKLIYKRSQDNVTTSYDNLIEELAISRPTARNRIGTLMGLGYLVETKRGRRKIFEFTEKGRNLFH